MLASKDNNNEQVDADILQCKADVLRARDIISPGPERTPSSRNNIPEAQGEQIKPSKKKPAEIAIAAQEKAEIPRFDLAEEIMAEQRKITAIRRKAPSQKIEAQSQEPEAESIPSRRDTIEQPMPALSEQKQIIAEIVARDIERLRRGGALVDS